MAKKLRYTWQQVQEDFGLDFQEIYYRRLAGDSWWNLRGPITEPVIARLAKEWCVDNGIDPTAIDRKNIGNGIITDSRCVDSGRVKALRKAGWKVFDIAVDCHCTEDCVKEILNEV